MATGKYGTKGRTENLVGGFRDIAVNVGGLNGKMVYSGL